MEHISKTPMLIALVNVPVIKYEIKIVSINPIKRQLNVFIKLRFTLSLVLKEVLFFLGILIMYAQNHLLHYYPID